MHDVQQIALWYTASQNDFTFVHNYTLDVPIALRLPVKVSCIG